MVDFLPHLDMISVDSSWPQLELVTLNLTGPHPDLELWTSPVDHYDLDTLFLT